MPNELEIELSRIKKMLDAVRADLDTLSSAGAIHATGSIPNAGAVGTSPTESAPSVGSSRPGNVVVSQAGDCLVLTGAFAAGDLSLTMDAKVDIKTGRTINGHEIMLHRELGEVFKRTHGVSKGQVTVRYDFGAAVPDIKSLVLVAEGSRSNTFVHGQADGFDLFPSRVLRQGCSCGGTANSAAMVDLGEGKAKPLTVAFPVGFTQSLKPLIAVIEDTIGAERYLRGNIEILAFASCFWGTVACELAAKACILGCAGNPICMAACLVAEVACLLALDESKQA
ncbi:MAG: hypothetical protein AB7J34_22380 [Limisphaerales bacterium]